MLTRKRQIVEETNSDTTKKEKSQGKMEDAKEKMRAMFKDFPLLQSNTPEFSTFWHNYEQYRIELENAAEDTEGWLAVEVVNACHRVFPISVENLEKCWAKIDLNGNHWYEVIERQMRSFEVAAFLCHQPVDDKEAKYPQLCRVMRRIRLTEGFQVWMARMYDYYKAHITKDHPTLGLKFPDSIERILRTETYNRDWQTYSLLEDMFPWETPCVDICCETPYNPNVNWNHVWNHLTAEQKAEQMRVKVSI